MKTAIKMALLALTMTPLMALAQQSFSTPEQGANALVDAISQKNDAALTELLGENWQQFLPPEGVDPEAVARFLRDWKVNHHVVTQSDIAWVDVGNAHWRLPIPLEKNKTGWQFNMATAQDEIITRTIGRNELSAIQAMHAYVDAQLDYYQLNQAWAQKLISSEGKKDGLYWPIKPGEAPSPLGPNFSPADYAEGYHGYHFRIIQESNEGEVALLAWPVTWGTTGIVSFIVDQDDQVYESNLGPNTEQQAQDIKKFNPTPAQGWQVVRE